jgi:hypothetical protein
MQNFCSLVIGKFLRDAFAPSPKAIYVFLMNHQSRKTTANANSGNLQQSH